jgi:DNA-binding transcriptional LysR family regulator
MRFLHELTLENGRLDRLTLMHSFVRVVESGSFSAVARELGLGQPNVSRQVAALEEHLGARLLHRSTRKLTLTPEGERFYQEARRVLDAMAEAESSARGQGEVRGLLRMACPTLLGRSHVLPAVKPLLERYPHLELDVQVSDRFIDLIEEGIDLAVRIGVLGDSALKARRVGLARRLCVASREYIDKHGMPVHPKDLERHDCIVYTLASTSGVWSFGNVDVSVRGSFRVNTPDGVRSATLDGIGISYAPAWLLEDALADGRAVRLLVEFEGPPVPIHIVYAANRLLPARARAVMDYLGAALARDPMLGGDQVPTSFIPPAS